jgi:uncharacterized YigZ family protein
VEAVPGELALERCLRPLKSCEFALKEKRSEFLALLFRADSVDEARATLEEIRRRHFGATHHCPAWRIGFPETLEFCSDDGEPSGTAGRPILGELKRAGLCCAGIVVTRYFGGVKLGVRGLIDAYGAAAAGAIGRAEKEACAPFRLLTLQCEYGNLNALLRLVRSTGVAEERIRTCFDARVSLQVFAAPQAELSLGKKLQAYDARQLLCAQPLWGKTQLLALRQGE